MRFHSDELQGKPEERLMVAVSIVINTPVNKTFALGPYRAECYPVTSKKWRYRVWHVLDAGNSIINDRAVGMKRAVAKCIEYIIAAAWKDHTAASNFKDESEFVSNKSEQDQGDVYDV